MVGGRLFEPAQRRQRLLGLVAVDLKFRLCQKYGIGGFRNLLVGQPQPFVAALVLALKMCGSRGLQVVSYNFV